MPTINLQPASYDAKRVMLFNPIHAKAKAAAAKEEVTLQQLANVALAYVEAELRAGRLNLAKKNQKLTLS